MADVTKPKKIANADTGSEPLIIQSRPIIGRATSLGSSSDEDPSMTSEMAQHETPSAPTLPSQSKRTLVVPISDGLDKAEDPEKEVPSAVKEPGAAPTVVAPKTDEASDAPEDTAAKEKPEPEKAEKSADTPTKAPAVPADTTSDDAETKDAESDDDKAVKKDEKPNPETEKAIAEAAAAAKRERELEGLIDSKQFYVPINAVARKREVKHSAFMTFVVLLLALILVDLMLDSGLILLAEKIPHTHFFTTSSIDQK